MMDNKKRVLIITYYWPPGTGAGVFRWLKFSKFLGDFGWEPVIYTPENPEAQGTDHSLEKDIPGGITVLRRPIREPYRYYKILTGRKQEEKIQSGFLSERRKPGLADKVATWIRGNCFIPDARKFWIKPSVRFLTRWLHDNPVDAILSTGPPHSMHIIGMKLKERFGMPWLADFRDPWTQIDFYDKLMLTPRADRKHRRLEQKVLSRADKLLTVSQHGAHDMEKICGRHVEVVTNGFDPDDFSDLPPTDKQEFCITHLGSMNADRNPDMLWKVLSGLVMSDPFFSEYLKVRLIGKTDFSVQESLIHYGIHPFVECIPPLSHHQALAKAATSAILLLPLNNTPNVMGITTGKLFDYLGLRRPILCIGPPSGDAATIIRETQSGTTVHFHDENRCRDTLMKWASLFRKNQLHAGKGPIHDYDRKKLTASIAQLLDDACGNM